MGARYARHHHQRILRPDRVQFRARLDRQARRLAGRGAIGKAVPGHHVAIVDDEGQRSCRAATVGQIAVKRPDPVMFLGYWNDREGDGGKIHRRLAD